MKNLFKAFAFVCTLSCCQFAISQTATPDNVSKNFKQLSDAEKEALLASITETIPYTWNPFRISEVFRQKVEDAEKLGDFHVLFTTYRRWAKTITYTPAFATINMDGYANAMKAAGEDETAVSYRSRAIENTPSGVLREYRRSNLAFDMFKVGRISDAQNLAIEVEAELPKISVFFNESWNSVYRQRAKSVLHRVKSEFAIYRGQLDVAVEEAKLSAVDAREALNKSLKLGADPNANSRDQGLNWAAMDLAAALGQRISALRESGKFSDSEEVLREFMRFSQEMNLKPAAFGDMYFSAGSLRSDLREFATAENYWRKADVMLDKQGYPNYRPRRIEIARNIALSLEGQKRWKEALEEVEHIDKVYADVDIYVAKRTFPFERGYAYLGNETKYPEASEQFQELLNDVIQRYPENHFYVGQAQGLLGVAQWRLGTAASKEAALTLLQKSVQSYMNPDNFDFEARGLATDVRELVFATYLDAMFSTPGTDPLKAMAPADWARGGIVQEALNDAAIRSATSDPKLSELVRRDQDAKNEIAAMRRHLASESGKATALDLESAEKIRSRIDAMDVVRHQAQSEIHQQFAEYEKLVRPKAPTLTELSKALGSDEVFVLLLPTEHATYVWATSKDGNHAAAKVDISAQALGDLVSSVRNTLDFAAMENDLVPFNANASYELYQTLLAPVEKAIKAKNHIIISAGGRLGHIPFGVLLTQPASATSDSTNTASNTSWLIKKAAVTHVPSISGWLAAKQIANANTAPEPLIAWGDPRFSTKVVATTATNSARKVILSRVAKPLDLEKEELRSALNYADIPALPETRDELIAIASVLKADPQSDLRFGEFATKSNVLQSNRSGELQKKRVVAFATHGLMARDLPHLTQPALALASTGNEDKEPLGALLTLDEVLNLKLNADWVILSACNTAAADGKVDEALSGLARGFFYAGSRSLLVTHWAVESESAKELTTNTMMNYMANPMQRKAESLRQAMLTVMSKPQYKHPAYWAPYALVGDGGR